MERGWFHTAMGYWQTTGEVPASVLQSYPDGTIEVPVKPSDSHEWNGSNWVYVAPPPPDPAAARAQMRLSFAQMLIGLVSEGWITAEEGRAWRDRVGLPAPVTALIAGLPVEQQFAAETRAMAPSEILRNDPLVAAMGAAEGKTPEQLDQFFTTYAEV